MYRRMN